MRTFQIKVRAHEGQEAYIPSVWTKLGASAFDATHIKAEDHDDALARYAAASAVTGTGCLIVAAEVTETTPRESVTYAKTAQPPATVPVGWERV